MKLYKRLLSVFLVCVCLFGVCSLNVSAADSKVDDLNISVRASVSNSWSDYDMGSMKFNVGSGKTGTLTNSNGIIESTYYACIKATYTFNAPLLMNGGNSADVKISNLKHVAYFGRTDDYYIVSGIDSARILLFYENGDMEYVDDVSISQGDSGYNFTFTVTPQDNVKKFELLTEKAMNPPSATSWRRSVYLDVGDTEPLTSLTFSQDSKSETLLGGILEWIKGIFDSIAELPQKLWNLISNGLHDLFVPDEAYIETFKSKFDDLLADRLGAVYECVNVLVDMWDSIQVADVEDSIYMGEVTIPLPEDNSFTFGGFYVRVVPEGFEWLADIVKFTMSMVCAVLFFNGLRKRYDEVVGGDST